MAQEIERKFLLKNDAWRKQVMRSQFLRQGYLASDNSVAVRVRIAGDKGFLTVKSAQAGRTRSEYEYIIPISDAQSMLDELCSHVLEKTRHWVSYGAHTWEIDVFEGANMGLILAEVELETDDETVEIPPWISEEVTEQRRYYNAELARCPYAGWD